MPTPLDPMRHLIGSQPVQPQRPAAGERADEALRNADGKTFDEVMGEFVNQVDGAQKDFDKAIEAVERGELDNLHQGMLAQNQAQLSLKLAAEVRDKLVEAYKEVMRTQM